MSAACGRDGDIVVSVWRGKVTDKLSLERRSKVLSFIKSTDGRTLNADAGNCFWRELRPLDELKER